MIGPTTKAPNHQEQPDFQTAIAHARDARDTHVRWFHYLESGGESDTEAVGDVAHHQKMIARYDNILECLLLAVGLLDLQAGRVRTIEEIRERLAKP